MLELEVQVMVEKRGFLVLSSDWDLSETSLHEICSLPFPWLLSARYCTDPVHSDTRADWENFSCYQKSQASSLPCLGSCHHYSFKRSFQLFLLPCIIGFLQGWKPCRSLVYPSWCYSLLTFSCNSFACQLNWRTLPSGEATVTHQLKARGTLSTLALGHSFHHPATALSQSWPPIMRPLSPAGSSDPSPVAWHQHWAKGIAQRNSVIRFGMCHHLLN